jgi:DNA-binding IclR family transcriptional regulator
LYCTGVGKIFLATLTTQKLEKYFQSNKIKAFTPNTITRLDQLRKHLMKVAREGVAYDNEEWYLGVRTVAAGIRDSEEKLVGCIDVTGPTVRLTPEMQKEMAPYVKQYAMKISIDLGYRENS